MADWLSAAKAVVKTKVVIVKALTPKAIATAKALGMCVCLAGATLTAEHGRELVRHYLTPPTNPPIPGAKPDFGDTEVAKTDNCISTSVLPPGTESYNHYIPPDTDYFPPTNPGGPTPGGGGGGGGGGNHPAPEPLGIWLMLGGLVILGGTKLAVRS